MSANRSNIDWHLANMIGGRDLVPKLGEKGYAPGAIAIKSTGIVGNGIYINYGTFDSCDFISQDGLSAILDGGVEQDIYQISTTQNYMLGSRMVLHTFGGSRVYRYCKSGAACDTFIGNIFHNAIPATGIDYAAPAADAAAGATSIILDNGSVVAQTLNGLRGGNIIMSPTAGDNNTVQQRGITGNTVAAKSAECTITFDKPLYEAVTTSGKVWCMPSPYKDIRGAQYTNADITKRCSFVGYAAVSVTAADVFHWEQVAGPIAASLYGSGVGTSEYMREVAFRYDGNLTHRSGATTEHLGPEIQVAGYIMDNNVANNGATITMLQLDR